jgi:RimJ/RimL family protein N-acetyltransferase
MMSVVGGEVVRGAKVVLREKRLSDAEADYTWRSDAELARFDAARPFSGSFDDYRALYEDELTYPNPFRRTLAIEDHAGRHIGNVMYYNIDHARGEAELGITIGAREYWGQGYGSDAVGTLLRHLLTGTALRRVYLKTLDWNERARRCFEKAGFVAYGTTRRLGHDFILMEVRREWLMGGDEGTAGQRRQARPELSAVDGHENRA